MDTQREWIQVNKNNKPIKEKSTGQEEQTIFVYIF